MDGRTSPASIWLMNPLVSSSPASWAWLKPASRRAARTRSPRVCPAFAPDDVAVRIDGFGTAPIITTHDNELRLVPTLGSVVEMGSVRAVLLAIEIGRAHV